MILVLSCDKNKNRI